MCVCRGQSRGTCTSGGETSYQVWKPDTSFVFIPHIITGKMRRGMLVTKFNFEYVSHEPKSLFFLAFFLSDVSSPGPVAWTAKHGFKWGSPCEMSRRTLISVGPVYTGHCIYRAARRKSCSSLSVDSTILNSLDNYQGAPRKQGSVVCWGENWRGFSTLIWTPHLHGRNMGPSLSVSIWVPHTLKLKEIWTSTPYIQLCKRWKTCFI